MYYSSICALSENKKKMLKKKKKMLCISLLIAYENLVLDQDNNFYQISLSLLVTCLLDNIWKLWREVIGMN